MPEAIPIKTGKKNISIAKIDAGIDIDFSHIQRNGYQIIRGFGLNTLWLESELSRISDGKLFFSARLGSFIHEFRVLPHSENLSEQSSCGGYHTDFMFQPSPPAYIALLCLRTDPKHPIYGRNQVVHRDAFLERLEHLYGLTTEDLLKLEVGYSFPGRPPIRIPLLRRVNGQIVLSLHTSLMPEGKLVEFSNLPLKSIINAVCGDIAHDFVLDQGDLLIVSNHLALHRRSECTLAFNSDANSFVSREMATVRFDL